MMPLMGFYEKHILAVLEGFGSGALDFHLSRYFRRHKKLGKRDRARIGEAVWQMVRYQVKLDHLGGEGDWKKRWRLYQTMTESDADIPSYARVSFPKEVFDRLVAQYGEEEAIAICEASNGRAPTTIRVNTLKTTRAELLEKLGGEPTSLSDVGIAFPQRVSLLKTPEYEQGLFELQDEGSQLVAAMCAAKPKDKVLDYCAGSGGKALAIGSAMQNQGQLFLHDIRSLHNARRRLKRAGVQNVQFTRPPVKGAMSWVLVDAPCTGSGTWRRKPEMKGRFDLQRCVELQRQIVEEAIEYLAPAGKLVYATCSLFREENEDQIDYFSRHFGLVAKEKPFKSLPSQGSMDGFFAAVLIVK